MKIRWFDAAVCVPKESGTYLTVSGISELSFTSLDWSAKNRAWNVADNSGDLSTEIKDVTAWAVLPSPEELREELSREE